ncbi:BON domain-containing protein [Parvibaculaceae bacterium PLY_AMNH_Bact1]|nr:BON domain-containing protein [Parvibaculaceae bacterium PLY_AMNH_Bact1]
MRFNRFSQRSVYRAAVSIGGLCVLGACSVPGMVIGAGATAGIAAAEERGMETALDDLQIDVEIKRQFLEQDEALLAAVSTEVHGGRVLLTGVVDEPEMRMTATRLSWGVDGVVEVINEITVAGDASIAQASKDIFISTELRARLMGDGDVSAINYSIETVRGTIYLLGIARSESELRRVINHARNVSGVRNIVPYVRVKPHEEDQPV